MDKQIVMIDKNTGKPLAVFDKVVTAVKYVHGEDTASKKYLQGISGCLRGIREDASGYIWTYISYFKHKPEILRGVPKYKLNRQKEIVKDDSKY